LKSSSAKAKGRRASQEVRDLLLAEASELEAGDISVVPSGVTGKDLWLSPAAEKVYPLAIEVKNQESLNIWSALEQAEGHKAKDSEVAVVFFKRNRSKLYACLDATEFVRLVLGKRQHR
jgi:hypothetical protein